MPSTATSVFSSAPGTSRLDVPNEIQHPTDFESTRMEPVRREEEEITEPGLELDRLHSYEIVRDKKKLRSFIWQHGWRLVNDCG